MKKLIALFLLIALCIALFACGGEGYPNPCPQFREGQGVRIKGSDAVYIYRHSFDKAYVYLQDSSTLWLDHGCPELEHLGARHE